LGVGGTRYYAAYDNVAAVHRMTFFGNFTGFNGVTTPEYNIHLSGTGYATGDWRAPIFYDSGNTAYYTDPASTSVMNTINLGQVNTADGNFLSTWGSASGTTRHLNLSSYGGDPSQAHTGQSGITWGYRADSQAYYMIYLTHGDYSAHTKLTLSWHTGIRIGAAPDYGGTAFYNNSLNVGPGLIFSVGRGDSNVRVYGDIRSPIYYDLDNTGYYTNPASTSVLNGLTVGGGTIATTSGSPSYYMARAWVNFNGVNVVAIRSSVNVSSITDNGVGDYFINFTTAMPDENYVLLGTRCGNATGSYVLGGNFYTTAPTTTAARVILVYPGVAAGDDTFCMVTIFR
jgi:hypothetical protein